MNHSHGYKMRLQTARELAREAAAKRQAALAKRRAVREALDRLVAALNAVETLSSTLMAYELTGDHDHSLSGTHPVPVGAPCPGGDCPVARARQILKALEG